MQRNYSSKEREITAINCFQVDQTKTNSDNMDTESVFYDNTDMDTARYFLT